MLETILNLDPAILFWLQAHVVNPYLSPIMIVLTTLGNGGFIWGLFAIFLLWKPKYRVAGVSMLLALIFTVVFGAGIFKHLVMRVRPCFVYPDVPMLIHIASGANYSFPSDHAFSSFAAAVSLFPFAKRRLRIGVIVLAVSISFSRLYLFAHFPSDVLAGTIFGICFGLLASHLARAIKVPREYNLPVELRLLMRRKLRV